MHRSRLVAAAVLLLLGLFWIGQGSGTIGGSAMSGSGFWEAVGIILVGLGIVVAVMEWIRRPNSSQ